MSDTVGDGGSKPPRAARGPAISRKTRVALYAVRRLLPRKAQKELGLSLRIPVYFKDPAVAAERPGAAFDEELRAPWEPGLRDGPTSARFAVVDYDATTGALSPPAVWDEEQNCFLGPGGVALDEGAASLPQFHQVSVWATVQHTLDFFESRFALGRRISWAFEGERLIVVPHAGCGENAYYDRASKSLQFYWFDGDEGRIYTCLSSDIVNHEFAHAVLDGLRPLFLESVAPETGAFHEFTGDLTALLMALLNNGFRRQILADSGGDLDNASLLASLAQQFGEAVGGAPYLRTALNTKTMADLAGSLEPHALSEVLTGAMFDIIRALYKRYKTWSKAADGTPNTRPKALWYAADRMQRIAIQPLDLLPPCDVTFRDYALAVLRSEQVAEPTDPQNNRKLMFDIFVARGILSEADRADVFRPRSVFERADLDVFHDIDTIGASRGSAYRFLDDNRAKLLIPPNADLSIAEVVRARKYGHEARMLPDQIVVQYIWREDLELEGARFGRFAGERTSMLCGATLVLDQNGNLIHWSRKPGFQLAGAARPNAKAKPVSPKARAEQAAGLARRDRLLDVLAARIAAGAVGETVGGTLGIFGRASPPYAVRSVDGALRFEITPHFAIGHDVGRDGMEGRRWQIDC